MMKKITAYKVFRVINAGFLCMLALLCLLPLLNVLAISFSNRAPVAAGQVIFWPKEFTLAAYEYVLKDDGFLSSVGISVLRVLIGVTLNIGLVILCAYPLSKSQTVFYGRSIYVWIFLFASLFGGGLIPTYMVIQKTGLIDSIFALIIPGCVPITFVIMMLNFFRGLPRELEEAALMDGAGQWKICWMIYVPLSKASIATITLFCFVNHWNSWFDGMIYINNTALQPLATFLHKVVVESSLNVVMQTTDINALNKLLSISDETTKSAQTILAMIPIIAVYPFVQKYFSKGVTMGSVKG